jgi:hypothetical protein
MAAHSLASLCSRSSSLSGCVRLRRRCAAQSSKLIWGFAEESYPSPIGLYGPSVRPAIRTPTLESLAFRFGCCNRQYRKYEGNEAKYWRSDYAWVRMAAHLSTWASDGLVCASVTSAEPSNRRRSSAVLSNRLTSSSALPANHQPVRSSLAT